MAEQKLPNFFVVGAAKAGSTSVYNYLYQHPDVYMSPVKEPHYFASDMDTGHFRDNYKPVMNKDLTAYLEGDMKEPVFQAYIREWSQYIKLFKNVKNETAIGEVSNSYLYSSTAAKNIHDKIPGAKIVIILRNPVDRAFSHFIMDLRTGYTEPPFMNSLKKDMALPLKGWGVSNLYVEIGLYYEQVKRYMELFPQGQLHIVLFDDFKKNTAGEMKKIFSFLGVNPGVAINYNESYNESTLPRNKIIGGLYKNKKLRERITGLIPKALKKQFKKAVLTNKTLPVITEEERSFLEAIFYNDVSHLSNLIGRDLSSWQHV
jgi:hypothetical protein